MASPAVSESADKPKGGADHEQVPFQFCRECSNMLLPKEDRTAGKLVYVCRTCSHTEQAQTPCVYRNQLHNTVGETAGVTQDVGADPTVGASAFASRNSGVVAVAAPVTPAAEEDVKMACCTPKGVAVGWHFWDVVWPPGIADSGYDSGSDASSSASSDSNSSSSSSSSPGSGPDTPMTDFDFTEYPVPPICALCGGEFDAEQEVLECSICRTSGDAIPDVQMLDGDGVFEDDTWTAEDDRAVMEMDVDTPVQRE